MPDTIVALATPTGRSGIGVIRLSGEDALSFTQKIVIDGRPFIPRQATLAQLHRPDTRESIDEAIITYFKAPNSFTGEDVVEFSCHGSPVVLRELIDILLGMGARLAEPGEFSLRALANGRMDLTEAEAIRDLINAQTTASARQAIRQLRGEFSHELQPLKDKLLDVIVVLESALEFVEDDLPAVQAVGVSEDLSLIRDSINEIAATFKAGRLIREGLRVAIVGRPNVGKSSLFNALLGSDRAIVTDIAGTTRDQLHERFTVGDIPVSLVDTAGLRETSDTVEIIGVERSRRTMADADRVIVMVDVTEGLVNEDLEVLSAAGGLSFLVAVNKIDKVAPDAVDGYIDVLVRTAGISNSSIQPISALKGGGLDNLRRAIVQPYTPEDVSASGFLVSDARHYDLLNRAAGEIDSSLQLLSDEASEEIVLIGLHNALRYLGQITGEMTTEDMLGRIFSTFCIGK